MQSRIAQKPNQLTQFIAFSMKKYCVFSQDFRIFQTLAFLCFPLVSVSVHTPPGWQNWHSSEKSQNLKEKTQCLMNTLYDEKNTPIEAMEV